MRLLCDEMLARVGRWLRIAGYDTVWCEQGSDDDVVLARAIAEERVLLSADRELIQRAEGRVPSLHVPNARLDVCVPLLQRALGVDWQRDPWSRCVRCNTVIVEHHGFRPPNAPNDKPLFRCVTCERVYWEGGHATRFSDRLGELRSSRMP